MAWKWSCLPVRTSANAFFRYQSPYSTPGPRASVEYRSSAIIPEFYQGELPPACRRFHLGMLPTVLRPKPNERAGNDALQQITSFLRMLSCSSVLGRGLSQRYGYWTLVQ